MVIGGGMAYTFLKVMGHEVGTSLIENDSIIPLISFNFALLILFWSEEFTVNKTNSKKAFLNPSSITLFLSKFISNGFEISMLLISNAFPWALVVEKKNIVIDQSPYDKCRISSKINLTVQK